MKQIVPFYKEIVFEKKIANLVSISLEHSEKILEGEISGQFTLYGEYKSHNDTTEVEEFKYKLPFTALLPDDVDTNTVKVDITNFNYEQIEENVLRVDIDFSIEGEEVERHIEVLEYLEEDNKEDCEEDNLDDEIESILNIDCNEENELLEEEIEEVVEEHKEDRNNTIEEDVIISSTEEKVEHVEDKLLEETQEEYVTYHVHVVSSKDSVESIMKTYNVNLDLLKEYNDIKELKIGDKVLIPECIDE